MGVKTVYECDACPVPVVGEVYSMHALNVAEPPNGPPQYVYLCHLCAVGFIAACLEKHRRASGTSVNSYCAVDPVVLNQWAEKRRKQK